MKKWILGILAAVVLLYFVAPIISMVFKLIVIGAVVFIGLLLYKRNASKRNNS